MKKWVFNKMKEREFNAKFRKMFEDLRGHTDMMILNVYYSLDEKGNVLIDTDTLQEEFEEELKNLVELTK